jgi:hypothetical protein
MGVQEVERSNRSAPTIDLRTKEALGPVPRPSGSRQYRRSYRHQPVDARSRNTSSMRDETRPAISGSIQQGRSLLLRGIRFPALSEGPFAVHASRGSTVRGEMRERGAESLVCRNGKIGPNAHAFPVRTGDRVYGPSVRDRDEDAWLQCDPVSRMRTTTSRLTHEGCA